MWENVGKILGIGRNYRAHAKEMQAPIPVSPMVFLKPRTALLQTGGQVVLPPVIGAVHHELELVVEIGENCRHVLPEEALRYVSGYGLGLDLTARDIQGQAKERGHPWSVAKGYDTFAPLGPLTPAAQIADPQSLTLRLQVNGETRQACHTSDMIFPVSALIAFCSTVFTLEAGDLIYTGTPEGVGPIVAGDRLWAESEGLEPLEVTVVAG